jgi:hypothetical protein
MQPCCMGKVTGKVAHALSLFPSQKSSKCVQCSLIGSASICLLFLLVCVTKLLEVRFVMATHPSSVAQPNHGVELRVPLEEARSKLKERIRKGNVISDSFDVVSINNEKEFISLVAKYNTWRDINVRTI